MTFRNIPLPGDAAAGHSDCASGHSKPHSQSSSVYRKSVSSHYKSVSVYPKSATVHPRPVSVHFKDDTVHFRSACKPTTSHISVGSHSRGAFSPVISHRKPTTGRMKLVTGYPVLPGSHCSEMAATGYRESGITIVDLPESVSSSARASPESESPISQPESVFADDPCDPAVVTTASRGYRDMRVMGVEDDSDETAV